MRGSRKVISRPSSKVDAMIRDGLFRNANRKNPQSPKKRGKKALAALFALLFRYFAPGWRHEGGKIAANSGVGARGLATRSCRGATMKSGQVARVATGPGAQ